MGTKKTFEVTLSVSCDIEDFDKSNITEDLKTYENFKELINQKETWEQAERQKRLFHALLNNKATFQEYVKKQIILEAYDFIEQFSQEVDDIDEVYAISQRLENEEDAKFYEQCEEHDVFTENIEHVINRFKTEVEYIKVIEQE